MKKAVLTIIFALSAANFAVADEATENKINDKLNKTGDKIEAVFDKDKPENKEKSSQINDDLNKTGDKIEGTFDKAAVKRKKAARKAKKKAKQSVKNTEDEVKAEDKTEVKR